MIRVLLYLAFVLAAGFAAVWVADQSGMVSVVLGDMRYEMTLGVALVGVVAVATLTGILWTLIRLITRGPDALSLFMQNRRRAKGLDAVTRGLVAVGTGDERAARRAMREARRLLPGSPLTRIVEAQSAQLLGDRSAAEASFRAMLEDGDTRALGLRGLFIEARRRGDAETARALAENALRTTPEAPWAGPALLDFQCMEGDWASALSTVERNAANRVTDRATARRQRAVLLTAQAQERAERETERALTLALEAVKLAPDLVPAATLAAKLLAEADDPRRAMKVVEAAWKVTPHPDLAEVYLRARHGDTAQDRLKKARALVAKGGNHPEGALALARAAIDAREFDTARTALKPLIEAGATVRVCLLMAEIEDAEQGDRAAARGWLARAVAARRDPVWIADGIALPAWAPVSPSGRLGGVEWGLPADALGHASPVVEAIVREAETPRIVEAATLQPRPEPETQAAEPKIAEHPEPETRTAVAAEAKPQLPGQPEPPKPAPVAPPLPRPKPAPVPVETGPTPPLPDDPGTGGDPLVDEGAPPPARTPAFGPP